MKKTDLTREKVHGSIPQFFLSVMSGRKRRSRRFASLFALAVISMAAVCQAREYALTVYGGRTTGQTWMESLSLDADFTDAYIFVGALAWTVSRYHEEALTLELEGQVGKYFGDQDLLEFNFPAVLRWRDFPWNSRVDTSLAIGLGPSWATRDPPVEKSDGGTTRQLLVYWFIEIATGPPEVNWSGVFRLHHRSTGFGLLARDGGSNTLCAGLKVRF